MSKLDIIREILNDKFRMSNQNYLTEKDIDSKGKVFEVKYKIVKSPQVMHELFRFDKDAFPFFKDLPDLKKMCDYILFTEDSKHLYVFVIELKLGGESAFKQLNAASVFVKFIIESSVRIGKQIDDKYSIRKIRICDKRVKKRRLIKEKIIFDNKDYCEYPFQNFYLETLMNRH